MERKRDRSGGDAVHEMVSGLGYNPSVTEVNAKFSLFRGIPQDIRFALQYSLIEYLAMHLIKVDHWDPNKGPTSENCSTTPIDHSSATFFSALRNRNRADACQAAYSLWLKGPHGPLEYNTLNLAAENPDYRVYWVDPGDMRTQMHQEAFPGEDISDRPLPEASVPGLVELLHGELPNGRYQAREIALEAV